MNKESLEMDWSQLEKPLPSNLFDKYTHQSILPPLDCLNIDEITWKQCRIFALNLAKKGFLDPLAILYTSFKRLYPNCPSIRSFSRWLHLYEENREDFKDYFKQYSIHSMNIQSTGELIRLIENLQIEQEIPQSIETYDQIWFLFSISIRIPLNDYALIADTLILDDGVTRFSVKHRKTTNSSRIHCLVALTPSGKFSNQLIICKQTKHLKINFPSSTFTHIIQTATGDIHPEHIQQWFEDFLSLSYAKTHSAILIDPRITLLTPEMETLCSKSNIDLITLDLNRYLIQILTPILSLFDKQCSEVNRLDKMFLKSACDLKRIIFTIWCSLRTLKQNEQIYQIYQQTKFWKTEDELYRQSLRTNLPTTILTKKKKKKSPVKLGNKTKLSSTTTVLNDIPNDLTPEQIFSLILQRQISISRASKYLGGTKLDYIKYCLSYKSKSSLNTGGDLVQLNTFMQSQSTIDWLRYLRSLYFWSCAKQLFLREIYRLTGIITRKRSMNMYGNGNIGSIRSCDLQSPGIFWKAFEDIHQIEFDNESTIDDEQWHNDFQQYLVDNKINNNKTQLWTIDTFEFPLTKKSTVLQLPEWNELRPMNLTPKVTVIYAFSSTGQSIEPCFIFPKSFHSNENDFFNDLGHLTSDIFLSYCKNYLSKQSTFPIVLIFCSRLPILSFDICSKLPTFHIYPYGYPFTRTLPFRYLFERRVRNNRSTNLMSELWKKKLLEEQRTHVLKDLNCTIENMKYHFQQVWQQIFNENQPFEDKCQQAFQQANIQIKNLKKKIKLISKRNSKKLQEQEIINQLDHLLNLITQVKEQITSANVSQILKMNNHIEQTTDSQISSNNNESIDDSELNDRASSLSSPPLSSESDSLSTNLLISSTNEKRSIDENDQPNHSKRLRTTDSNDQWTPPTKEFILHLQNQSSSLLQFTLALVNLILSSSSDCQLTDEHSHWLHTTMKSYGHNYNREKINLLIETACKIAKLNLVR